MAIKVDGARFMAASTVVVPETLSLRIVEALAVVVPVEPVVFTPLMVSVIVSPSVSGPELLAKWFAELKDRLHDAESGATGPVNERPPHY